MVVLRGHVTVEYYDDDQSCYSAVDVEAGSAICAMNIPAGTWHTIRSLESGTVILEMKDGVYETLQECDILI